MYKVLLADDEPLILAGLRHKIDWNSMGFEIAAECTDGNMLLEAIRMHTPDLILVDIQMPGKTGLQVLQEIQHVSTALSIVISGYSNFAYAQEALRYGVVDYLMKPVSSSVLKSAVWKARQKLDLTSEMGRLQTNLVYQFLSANLNQMEPADIFSNLNLSGSRKYTFVVALHEGAALKDAPEGEVAWIRHQDTVLLAVVHTDALLGDYTAFVSSMFRCDGSAGVSHPVEDIRQFLSVAEEAVCCLETCWFRNGIYLWPTEHEEQSVRHYLKLLEAAGQDDGAVSDLLSALPGYLKDHRLNMRSAQGLCSAVFARADHDGAESSGRPGPGQEIREAYASVNDLLSALRHALLPGQSQTEDTSSSRAIVFRVRELIEANYAEALTLQSMASKFHIDMSYLSSLFHEETGKTFTVYLTEVRVRHACDYLRTTDLSNAKIAQLCGFANDSYLKKVFRKVLGTTPSAYRLEQARNGNG